MKKYLKRKLINLLVKHLYKFVTVEDVLVQTKNGFFINGKKIETKYIKELKGQSKIILDLEAYQLIRRELIEVSNETMFSKSKDFDDVMFGKAMLYCLDLLHQKLTKLSNM